MGIQATNKCDKYRDNDQREHLNGCFREGSTCRNNTLGKRIIFRRFNFCHQVALVYLPGFPFKISLHVPTYL